MEAIETNVVKIGNSQGIRIPKTILEQCHLNRNAELEPRGDHLVVRSAAKPRTGWDEAFQAMAQRGDDTLLDGDTFAETSSEKDQWQGTTRPGTRQKGSSRRSSEEKGEEGGIKSLDGNGERLKVQG